MTPNFGTPRILSLLSLLAGVLLFFLDERYAWPLMGPGGMLVGAAFLIAGLDTMLRKRHDAGRQGSRTVYRGAGAIFWGLAFLLIGFGAVAVGLVVTLGRSDAMLALIQQRPGVPMLWGGLLCFAIGVGLSAPWRRGDGSAPPQFVLLPGRIGGSLLILLGLFVIALGGYEMLFPQDFDAAVQAVINTIPQPPSLPSVP
ncbi:MAG: hypothetical protein P8178_00710 [Candidatus Thiodiazotropha sp.]